MEFRKDKTSTLLIIIVSFLVNVVIFGVQFSLAAPTQSPPLGGVIQIDANASTPNPSLRINTTGEIDLGIWKATAVGISYGGTSSAQTGDTNCPGPSCVTGARTNLGVAAAGANSDITSLSPTGNLILTPTGNVGIGTTNPTYKLHITGDGAIDDPSSPELRFLQSGSQQGSVGWVNGYVFLEEGGQGSLVVKDGNVGIGTTSPAFKLDVNGDINIPNGNTIRANGNALIYRDTTNIISVGSGNPLDSLRMYAGGPERVRIDTSGNVGIGTTNPGVLLDVNGVIRSLVNEVHIRGSSPRLTGSNASGVNQFNVGYALTTTNVLDIQAVNSNNIKFSTTAVDGAITILNAGNVGIGTASPTSSLHVLSANANPIIVERSSTENANIQFKNSQGSMYAGLNPSENFGIGSSLDLTNAPFIVTSGGSVGIGVTVPAQKLSVAGTIESTSGGVKFPDGTTQTTAYAGSSQTLSAGNVSSGDFGSNTGGGNYSFPANVGIGAASPANKLILQSGVSDGFIFQNTAGSARAKIIQDSSGNGDLQLFDSGNNLDILLDANSGGVSYINAGNVGIGTASPAAKLDNRGTLNTGAVSTSGINWMVNESAKYAASFKNMDGGGYGVHIEGIGKGLIVESGNVGIGTTGPLGLLHIQKDQDALTSLRVRNDNTGSANYSMVAVNSFGNAWGMRMGSTAANNNSLEFVVDAFGTPLPKLTILTGGNVGIGTNTPTAAKLVIGGSPSIAIDAGAGRIQNLALTPINDGDAATKKYIDDLFSGGGVTNTKACSADLVCEMQGANLQGGNITGVGKITAATVDPLYEINGKKYATYGPETIRIHVEHFGKAKLVKSGSSYIYTLDFGTAPEGSDLWLFWQTIKEGKNMENIMVSLTPEGGRADLWYDILPKEKKVVIYGDRTATVSYHVVAQRFDTDKWPSILEAEGERGTVLQAK